MAYKSLLTIVTQPKSVDTTLAAATALARTYDAHLEVLCLAFEPPPFGYEGAVMSGVLIEQMFDVTREKVAELDAAVRAQLGPEDIRWSVESSAVAYGSLAKTVAGRARYCDLVVQAKPFGTPDLPSAEAVIEAALFDAAVPVLVLPEGPLPGLPGKRIIIAWDQSREALQAVRLAMPLLKAAELVTIMIVDPAKFADEQSDPGALLSQMLVRHGAKAEVTVLAKTLPRMSDVLNRHARDRNADMVVMGAYGHSRLRELILGGATRDMLEQAEMPVLMAH